MQVYVSPDHEKSRYGEYSPGPQTVGQVSSMGEQVNSRLKSAQGFGFGSASRFVYGKGENPGPGSDVI